MELDRNAPRIQAICLMVLTAIATGAALALLRDVLVPFVLALFLGVALEPVVDCMIHRLRMPRAIAVFATLLLGASLLVSFSLLVASAFATVSSEAPSYQQRLETLRHAWVDPALQYLHIPGDSGIQPLFDEQSLTKLLQLATDAGLSIASDGALVLIFLVFLLLRPSAPPGQRNETGQAIRDSIRHYVVVKSAIAVATGVAVGVTLWLLDVELALAFGLIAFFLNYIPTVGAWVSTLLPAPIVLLNPAFDTTDVFLALGIPGALQIVLGNLVEPRVMSSSLDLNTVVVVFGLVFWGTLWGMVGVFLAVPLTAAIKICLERMQFAAPLVGMLGSGRPPRGRGGAPPD
ncbi:MAG: AI-2E family transporter [Planctomycetes bacterium]|nr:AI-2E family transporter [Planctomycetota bacterium]